MNEQDAKMAAMNQSIGPGLGARPRGTPSFRVEAVKGGFIVYAHDGGWNRVENTAEIVTTVDALAALAKQWAIEATSD